MNALDKYIKCIRPFAIMENYLDTIFEDFYPGIEDLQCLKLFDKELNKYISVCKSNTTLYDKQLKILSIIKKRIDSLLNLINFLNSLFDSDLTQTFSINNNIINDEFMDYVERVKKDPHVIIDMNSIKFEDSKYSNLAKNATYIAMSHISEQCFNMICKNIIDDNVRILKESIEYDFKKEEVGHGK